MSGRWLPDRRLGTQTARRKRNTESKEQRLHHNSTKFYIASHGLWIQLTPNVLRDSLSGHLLPEKEKGKADPPSQAQGKLFGDDNKKSKGKRCCTVGVFLLIRLGLDAGLGSFYSLRIVGIDLAKFAIPVEALQNTVGIARAVRIPFKTATSFRRHVSKWCRPKPLFLTEVSCPH